MALTGLEEPEGAHWILLVFLFVETSPIALHTFYIFSASKYMLGIVENTKINMIAAYNDLAIY